MMKTGGPAIWAQWPARRGCCSSSVLPKTRSGKLLRRAMQAVCEGRDPG